MSLILTKKGIGTVWFVRCSQNGGESINLPETYTFQDTETEPNMETIIVNDLTSKGYTNLSPISWVTS